MPEQPKIRVFIADDNLIVRQGVRALISMTDDLVVVGEAGDYDQLVEGVSAALPQVVVTDIRMPPTNTDEGIRAATEVRKRHPGTGVVILSQYDEPEYALSLLSDGAAGKAYLLKDRVGEEDQLARSIRLVSTGGSMLDPKVLESVMHPAQQNAGLTDRDSRILQLITQGQPLKAIAATLKTTPEAMSNEIENLFLKLARDASAGSADSLRRLRGILQEIVDLEKQSETLNRLLPGGVAELLRSEGHRPGESQRLTVTVLMSDVRGYSGIAERTDPVLLARQLHEHRAQMNHAILQRRGTVMQFAGDAVMAVFGAPLPLDRHADHSLAAALEMHRLQQALNDSWQREGLASFGLGIALSTGEVAAALLGSDERLEYSVVGDVVNLTQRLQSWAEPGETIVSEPTYCELSSTPPCDELEPRQVKGRLGEVKAYRVRAETAPPTGTAASP